MPLKWYAAGVSKEPDADGFYTYTRPEGKQGGHGVGWSELPRYAFKVPPGWQETAVSIADLGGTEVIAYYNANLATSRLRMANSSVWAPAAASGLHMCIAGLLQLGHSCKYPACLCLTTKGIVWTPSVRSMQPLSQGGALMRPMFREIPWLTDCR